jgi:hypothetical protein
VALLVVIANPLLVHLEEFRPALRYREVVVGHPMLNVERCFHVVLPGLAALDLLLADVQRFVDGLRPVGSEDGTAVGDEDFRRAVPLEGVEDLLLGF